ncbi:hypothetical protein NEMBOFW57_004753 [Staphylotrichum longicolle]|uniref:Major facilitator superfamily (MFS) profile domain-containing protein n=1 Tax=Staphylotrichum longicolle TaxID=669026 RepID=A0AAD4I5Y5_9PEZI|nr:hypothetical protein NEMBOFW57_004753 [Staphylotrichum longicolle]
MAEKPDLVDEERSGANASQENQPDKEGGLRSRAERVHEFHESEGYIIDIGIENSEKASGLKLAKDRHTVLIPQPSDDSNDPLNWSWAKKHLILFVVSFVSFLPDYGSATGAVTLIPQAVEWNTTPDFVNHSQAGNVFMLGAGGVIAAWCAGATSFESFMAARILNGFFSTVSQAGGLMFLKDIFFFHEQARKINIWASFIVISPYMGPLLAAFMTETLRWPVPFWVYFAMNVVGFALTFAWAVGINTTLAIFVTPLYGFGPRQVGFFYFTPVVAVILGEATGHWMHDALAKWYIRRHNGHFEPEARLRAVFFSMPFVIVGLVLIGQCFENSWHYMATSVCWGMYVFGMMITTVALSSYCLDSYPEASGEVSAWLNMARTVGGFIVSYFQVTWAEAQGTKLSFGIQAAVCAGAFFFVVILLWRGKAMRVWAGPLNFATT